MNERVLMPRPRAHEIVVRQHPRVTMSAGGLHLPDPIESRGDSAIPGRVLTEYPDEGEVLAVGAKCLDVAAGDYVYFLRRTDKSQGLRVAALIPDTRLGGPEEWTDLLIMNERNVLLVDDERTTLPMRHWVSVATFAELNDRIDNPRAPNDALRALFKQKELSMIPLPSVCRADLHAVLDSAPNEVPGLLLALREGRIDGSTYYGDCACLVGTIANVRGCSPRDLELNGDRPAELWFLEIQPGDTPARSRHAAITEAWIVEWQQLQLSPSDD